MERRTRGRGGVVEASSFEVPSRQGKVLSVSPRSRGDRAGRADAVVTPIAPLLRPGVRPGSTVPRSRPGFLTNKRSKMDGIFKAIEGSNSALLGEEEKIAEAYKKFVDDLDAAENTIRGRAQALDARKEQAAQSYGNPMACDEDVIEVNAGGSIVAARRGTLCQLQGSRFQALFNGRWQKKLQKDRQGRIFLDINPKCFRAILESLRDMQHPADVGDSKPSVDGEHYRTLYLYSKMLGVLDAVKVFDINEGSKVLASDESLAAVRDLIKKDGDWTLLHRSTRDGFDAGSFHKNCDKKGSTMTVIKTVNGHVLGGYKMGAWGYPNMPLREDFLFSMINGVTHPSKMPCKAENKGKYHSCVSSLGPVFGKERKVTIDAKLGSGDEGVECRAERGPGRLEYSYVYTIKNWPPSRTECRRDLEVDGKSVTVDFGHTFEGGVASGRTTHQIKEMEVFWVAWNKPAKAKLKLDLNDTDTSVTQQKATAFAPQLNDALNAKIAILKRAEKAIARLEMQYDDEENFINRFACDKTKDVVTLNVDGTRMTTTRATLRTFEDSVLARQFDDEVWSQQPQTNVREWDADQVSAWAEGVYDLPQEAANVLANNKVTGRELLSLNMEALKMMGLERPATMSLLLDEIHELGEKSTDDSPFVEHNPYVFGKLLDFLRMRRLHKEGLIQQLPFPSVKASQQGRFSQLIEYYFPGDAKELVTG